MGVRPKDITTTAAEPASDDYEIIDGETNGTRRIAAASRATKIDVFTASGTWSKPPGARSVKVQAIGGGGGGEGGSKGAGATSGASGAGGGYVEQTFVALILGSVENVVVGEEGVAGTKAVDPDSSGSPGGDGGDSLFGSWLKAPGGGGGGQIGVNVGGIAVDVGHLGKGGNGVTAGAALPGHDSNIGGAGGGSFFAVGGKSGIYTLPYPLICPSGFGIIHGQSVPVIGMIQGGAGGHGGNHFGEDFPGGNGGLYGGGGGGGVFGGNDAPFVEECTGGGHGAPGVVVVTTYF